MKQFDVIVVGGGIAGLGVAGLLQKAGVQTLLLEKTNFPRRQVEDEGIAGRLEA